MPSGGRETPATAERGQRRSSRRSRAALAAPRACLRQRPSLAYARRCGRRGDRTPREIQCEEGWPLADDTLPGEHRQYVAAWGMVVRALLVDRLGCGPENLSPSNATCAASGFARVSRSPCRYGCGFRAIVAAVAPRAELASGRCNPRRARGREPVWLKKQDLTPVPLPAASALKRRGVDRLPLWQ